MSNEEGSAALAETKQEPKICRLISYRDDNDDYKMLNLNQVITANISKKQVYCMSDAPIRFNRMRVFGTDSNEISTKKLICYLEENMVSMEDCIKLKYKISDKHFFKIVNHHIISYFKPSHITRIFRHNYNSTIFFTKGSLYTDLENREIVDNIVKLFLE